MSTPEDFDMNQHISVAVVAAPAVTTPTTCFLGDHCTWIGPGHSMAFAQDYIAAAYPATWRDAVVDTVSPGGWITLTAVNNADRILAWNHCDLVSALTPGDPVSVNAEYHVLAAGDERFNVLVV